MDALINFIMTYLNPIYLLNLLWSLVVDAVYMLFQLIVDTLVLLLSAVNWLCPVFPTLAPPPMFIAIAKHVAWVIPWHYAGQMIVVMIGCTMFAIMTTWTLRWMKVIR